MYFSNISRGTERMGQIFDWDGTITGIPKAMIVRDQPFYVSSLCESRPNWGNMSICPHQYVSAEGTGSGYQKTSIIIKYIYLFYSLGWSFTNSLNYQIAI